MKKLFNPLMILFCAGTIISCSKSDRVFVEPDPEIINPITDYKIIKTEDPFTFKFENMSSKYKSLEWRFGDDTLRTDVSPTHTYLTTGDFQVDLKAFSELGMSSRKLSTLKIAPDSVATVKAIKTGVTNQVKFSYITKADVQSVLWTFNDTKPGNTSISLEPLKTFIPGALVSFTLKITTKAGSVAIISKSASTEGVVDDITRSAIYKPSAENGNTNENAAKLIDGKVDTKFLVGTVPLTLEFAYDSPQIVKLYAVGQANDAHERDPMTWLVEGSNNGTTWETVHSVTRTQSFKEEMEAKGVVGDARYKNLFYFSVPNPKPYSIYRWRITALKSGGTFQASEFRLFR
jgi:hypothetical protein